MSKSPYPFVHVTWNDANSPGAAETYEPTEIPHAPVVVETWGFALRQDEAGITVANERFEDGRYRGLTFIPGSMLVGIVRLTLTPKKARKKVPVVPLPPAGETSNSPTPQST